MTELWALVVVENPVENREEVIKALEEFLWKKFGVAVKVIVY